MSNWKKQQANKVTELALPGSGEYEFLSKSDMYPDISDTLSEAEKAASDKFLAYHDALTAEYDNSMVSSAWFNFVEFDPMPDTPLSLEQAVCLPELGGKLRNHINESVPSHLYTVNGLRAAISAGKLRSFLRNGKDRAVTRKDIQDWIASCRAAETPQPSNSNQSESTRTVASKKLSTSSNILTKEKAAKLSSAQDIAREKAMKLRNTLRGG